MGDFSASYSARFDVTDPEAMGMTGVTDPDLRKILGEQGVLDASSVPPVTVAYLGQNLALVAGAYTIDLAALPNGNLPNQDFTGLEVTGIVVVNPAGNGPLTVEQGVTNGYPVFGSAAAEVVLTAEATAAAVVAMKQRIATAVAAGAKTIDVGGTGTETFSVLILAG